MKVLNINCIDRQGRMCNVISRGNRGSEEETRLEK